MAGFRKAKAEQAAIKMGIYGPPGSGKTFTSLLLAEGLGGISGKRVAYIDTEHGTDFYCQAVPTRPVHPEAFNFDALYTRSITEAVSAVRGLQERDYSVIVVDSITHLWQACIEAYGGRQTSVGTIPMHAWGKIKKPYKDLMGMLLSSPMHVIICGRQGTEYATDEETEELKAVGVKMKAEGETAYEPHILIRMESIKPKKTNEVAQIVAYAEKDRTGVLSGRSFVNPTFASICVPLMPLLGGYQARIPTTDETANDDAERIAADDARRAEESTAALRQFRARIDLSQTISDLKAIGNAITPQIKASMTAADVASLREAYQSREQEIGHGAPNTTSDAAPKNEPITTGAVNAAPAQDEQSTAASGDAAVAFGMTIEELERLVGECDNQDDIDEIVDMARSADLPKKERAIFDKRVEARREAIGGGE